MGTVGVFSRLWSVYAEEEGVYEGLENKVFYSIPWRSARPNTWEEQASQVLCLVSLSAYTKNCVKSTHNFVFQIL